MAITYLPSPPILHWKLYSEVATLPGKNEALTKAGLQVQNLEYIKKDKYFIVSPTLLVSIIPVTLVYRKGANLTSLLLAHEQGHWDLAILGARAFTQDVELFQESTKKIIRDKVHQSYDLHLKNIKIITNNYDLETDHGSILPKQQLWKKEISNCMSQPNMKKIFKTNL